MNWNAIGAVAEIVGAFAVVVTLICLASQIRQATRATQAANFQAVSALEQEFLLFLGQDAATARTWTTYMFGDPADLPDDERMRAAFLMGPCSGAWRTCTTDTNWARLSTMRGLRDRGCSQRSRGAGPLHTPPLPRSAGSLAGSSWTSCVASRLAVSRLMQALWTERLKRAFAVDELRSAEVHARWTWGVQVC